MKRRFVAIVLSVIMAISLSFSVVAASSTTNSVTIENVAAQYGVNVDELINLEANLEAAYEKIESIAGSQISNGNQEISVKVSDNLTLVIDIKTSERVINPSTRSTRALYGQTVTTTQKMLNVFGYTLVELYSTGVFEYDKSSTVEAVDAYGDWEASGWSVSVGSSNTGGTTSRAWARTSFSGNADIGIDPISGTLYSFGTTGTIYCTPTGSTSYSWSK